MMKKLLYTYGIIAMGFLSFGAFAQQTNNWYFGSPNGTRIDFGSSTPSVTSGLLTTAEGSSAISDANGKPLFYTSGTKLWDATVTPNTLVTSSLLGDPSGTQSAIIMPKPGTTNQWIVFTGNTDVDGTNRAGLNYYTVTGASATSGPFSVSPTPVNLAGTDEIGEGLAIIGSTNPLYSFWVIVREVNLPSGSNQIRAYPVTTGGNVISTPVISSDGGLVTVAKQGFIKANTCQNKLAFTYMTPGKAEVYDFDANTGKVVTGSLTTLTVPTAYGVEFSPKSNYVYVTQLAGNLHQFTIGANGAAWADFPYSGSFGALQLAPNGKIYTTNLSTTNSLGVINLPDNTPAAGNFSASGLSIPNGVFRGLPNFAKSLITSTAQIIPGSDTTICKGSSLTLNYLFGGVIGAGATDFQWDIYDPTLSSTNTIGSFSHTFNNATAAGSPIKIRLTIKDLCGRVSKDSLFVTVLDIKTPSGSVSCSGTTITMTGNASDPDINKYIWYDAATGGNIYGTGGTVTWVADKEADAPGAVWVEIGATASTATGSGSVGPTAANLSFTDAGALTDRFSVLADRVTLKTFNLRPSAYPYSIVTNMTFDVEIKNGATSVYKQNFSFPAITAGASSAGSSLLTVNLNVDLIKGSAYTITISNVTSSNATHPLVGWYAYTGAFPQTSAGNFSNTGPTSGYSIFGNFTFDYAKSTITQTCSNRVKINRLCSLPVELVSFTAEKSGNGVQLNWVTAKEKDNSHFEVQRSINGANFSTITTLTGSGNSSSLKYYSTQDKLSSTTVYYRIKQVDYNGDATYSDVKSVSGSDVVISDINIRPNPNNGSFVLDITTDGPQTVRAEIFNTIGSSVWVQTVNSEGSISLDVNLGGLAKGVYFLKAAGITQKIVIE